MLLYIYASIHKYKLGHLNQICLLVFIQVCINQKFLGLYVIQTVLLLCFIFVFTMLVCGWRVVMSGFHVIASGLRVVASGLSVVASGLRVVARGCEWFARGCEWFVCGCEWFDRGCEWFTSGCEWLRVWLRVVCMCL